MLVVSVKHDSQGYLLVAKTDNGCFHKRRVTYACGHAFINKRGCRFITRKADGTSWYHLLVTKHWHIDNVVGNYASNLA